MLGQPLFLAGYDTPPPPAPVVDASPVLTLPVDSVSCGQEYEAQVVWSTTNPDNLNYKVQIVESANHLNVYVDDAGMSGSQQFPLAKYGGGASTETFQAYVRVLRRSTDVEQNGQDTNSIVRSNLGPPC